MPCLVFFIATVAAQGHAMGPLGQEDTDMSIDTLEAIYIGQAGWMGISWKNTWIPFHVDPMFERIRAHKQS